MKRSDKAIISAQTGGVAGNVENVLDGDTQAGKRTGGRETHGNCVIIDKGMDRIVVDQHGIRIPCPGRAPIAVHPNVLARSRSETSPASTRKAST